jgi:hypothetical protein
MPPINNLPPFKTGAAFPPPGKSGEWERAPGSLRELAISFQVDEDRPDASQATIIRAIPDPWAQARTFADALLDEQHSMHAPARAQWRGLLAIFALAQLRSTDYSIDVQPVELGTDHPFDRVLRHLAPQTAVGDNAALWLRPHVVYINPTRGRALPIALLNPASLVAPGRTSWRVPFDFIPWLRQGLSDPLRLPEEQALANSNLAVLEAYLANLREGLPRGGLRQQVEEYHADVVALKGVGGMTAAVRRPADSDLPALYQRLLLPAELEAPRDPAAVSETRLRLRSPASLAPLEGVILIDESVATTLGKRPRDVLVWGNATLRDLLDSPHALQAVQQEAAEHGYLAVTSDDLFTERMIRLSPGKEPRIPGHAPEMRDMLQPIRPLSLLLDQSGTRGLEVSRGDRRVAVTLHMKLDRGGAAGTPHGVIRTYRTDANAEAKLIDDADWDFGQAAVWPNFRSSQWSQYFARFTYPTTRELVRPQYALSAEIIAAAVAASPTAQHAIQALREINDGRPPAEKADYFHRFHGLAGKSYEEMQTSAHPFEAIFYIDYHPDRGEAAAGCARLKLLEPAERDNRISIAVDFGSTNSVACFSGSNGRPVTLERRIVHPITFESPARQDEWEHIVRWHFVEFLPLKDRPTPTPTVVISRLNPDRHADLWLHRNIIYFQPAGTHAKQGAAKEVENLQSFLKRSQFDLKWNEDPVHIDASADFLEQFMTMIAAEAVAAEYNPRLISWNFSVPDAMEGTRLESFRGQVAKAQQRLSPDGSLEELYSEGLAAARYILSGREGSKFTQGTINAILDIGGSTTDITLWVNEKLIWKGSFRLAGRAFFTSLIVNNPDMLRDIELDEWADLLDPDAAGQNAFTTADVGELLFSRPALGEAFEKHWQRRLSVKPGEPLRAAALVYISGIAHYLGLVARRLVEDGVIRQEDLLRPAFALCGRGAGIFWRMHGQQLPDRPSQVTEALRTFASAGGFAEAQRPQLFISPQPKIEVVAGMTVDFKGFDARVGSGSAASTYTPAGLQVEFAGGETLDAGLPIGTPMAVGTARGSNLYGLTEFLADLEAKTRLRVDLKTHAGQGAFNEISTEVRQKVERQRGEDERVTLREPPFITALSALVGLLASPAEERKARLSAEFIS